MSLFIIALPVALFVFIVGGALASPLEKYRHKKLAIWLAWNFLRFAVPLAILLVGMTYAVAIVRS
jgi:hypothetical protein